ncbi:hypothetical protein [Xylella taiwanensis]|nr:hypothetical protein [Xylella taiwanensis]
MTVQYVWTEVVERRWVAEGVRSVTQRDALGLALLKVAIDEAVPS